MVGLIITLIITIPISILWVKGIHNMKEQHPDYKGKDFLDWDDNKTNGEGMF
jgi:hypothetical protein